MDGTLIDHFRAFHTYSKEQELSASTRSIYFTLLGEFNVGFWPEELSFSDRTLQELSGVKSLSTIHDARNLLKSLNLIDFRKGKNRKIVYKLLSEHLANTNRTPSMQLPEHQANTCRTASEHSGLVSNAYAREDFKTERLEDSFQQQIQRARS